MLSNTCKTAIKAVIYLALKHQTNNKTAIKEIAEKIDASVHTIGKILQILVKQGVINSVKGPSGGFFLNEKQLQLTVIKIIEAIDGIEVFDQCGLGLPNCSSGHPCPIHNEYGPPREIIKKLYSEKKIIDLCDPLSKGNAFLMS